MPKRIQRKRTTGWTMPDGVVSCTRGGQYGNPFKIGGYYMKGDAFGRRDAFALTYTQALGKREADERYTYIETAEQAVDWFRWYVGVTGRKFGELRGKDLACWCPLGSPCHADVILEIANA